MEENTVPQAEAPEGKPNKPLAAKERKRQLRLLKWVEFFSAKNKKSHHAETPVSSTAKYDSNNSKTPSPGLNRTQTHNPNNDRSQSKIFTPTSTRVPPKPKLQSLTLQSYIFLTSPSFLNWTNQALSWCASTLTHLELQCAEAPSEIWCKFLSKLKLPSLIAFRIASGVLFLKEANVQGSDILGFLSRHPGIQKLSLHGIQVTACLSATPDSGKPILPNLTEVTAHPIWISWLLRNKKQCPKLKEIILLTECHTYVSNTFEYDAMDRTLSEILPRSHNLDLIGFKFTCDRGELDSWLQSHVDAGPNSMLSSFVNMKRLRIDSAYFVRIINPGSRLDLVAQVAGLFPNLDYLEFKEQPDVYQKTDHIPPVVEALRRYSPQVKQVKVNEQVPINIADFQSPEKE
ncbi:hypothetical protein EST38_g3091 [Candolleomyces aberdarensis]|uniref:Uncharacterized protein n=1 Tax=Candolleomyces aberdarensis TaxID=2316362 RepID=A0A4Q2DQW9_9AGAR|nr:hypothetical protein EST38_g3091 [Candolleomyces aberdarensis]